VSDRKDKPEEATLEHRGRSNADGVPADDAYAGLGAEDALRVMRAAAERMGGRDG
jgi:hypothetical protein